MIKSPTRKKFTLDCIPTAVLDPESKKFIDACSVNLLYVNGFRFASDFFQISVGSIAAVPQKSSELHCVQR